MKKMDSYGFVNLQKVIKPTLFKFSVFLFFCFIPLYSPVYASILSEQYHVSLSFEDVTTEEALEQISQQTGVKLAYSNKEIATEKRVSVHVETTDIQEALRTVLGEGYVFKEVEDYIAIARKEETSSLPGPQQDARDWVIQGQVLEASEPPYPMIGVNVRIQGTDIGTVTDVNGAFSIRARQGDVIVFTYLGFIPYEYTVSRAVGTLTISMKEDIAELEQVVITGFSTEKKLNTISSIASLDVGSNILNKPITSLSQALQGGITGLAVTQESGLPGADAATIKIRGISTLGESDPLVLVDGIPMDMNNLDPNTIETVTVLKDAAAAAIYGARAANGVIIITTKRGAPGKVSVSYNGYFGVQSATFLPKFVDAPTYMEIVNNAYSNIGGDPIYTQEVIDATRRKDDPYTYPDTDWADYIFSNGSLHSHSVSVSGGSSLARFALAVNYIHQEGLIEKSNADRLNIRANTSVSLLDNLSVNMDFNSYRTERQEPMYRANSYSTNIMNYMFSTPPNTVARYPMQEGSDVVFYGNRPEQRNPAALIDRGGRYKALEDNVSINIQPRWEVLPNFVARGQYSYRVSSKATNEQRNAYNFFDYTTGTLLETWDAINNAGKGRSSYYYLGGTLEYTLDLNKHRLFTFGGYNQELTNDGDWDQWAMVSLFAKANYTYDRRYLLEGVIRRDGSSRFGKGHKFGNFPSIAAGWNVNEETFMKSLQFINNWKLRASYGLLGNEAIGLYKYQTLVNASNGNETVFGNPDITWEKVHMLNIGTDLTLFKDLAFTFNYYDKLTTDMIITPPISMVGGISSADLNSGEVRNRGWELDINYGKMIKKNLSFKIHTGISHNKNKIESLYGAPYDNSGRGQIHEVGYALDSYYVYETDGLLQESDFTTDATGNLIPREGVVIFDGQKPGDIKYIDRDGDGSITPDDRYIKGDAQPKYNYFLNFSFFYKKWDFEILLQGVQGVDAYYRGAYAYGLDVAGDGLTPLEFQTDYWTPDNPNARYPRWAPDASYGNNGLWSDYWHFDASFCRVKYIQVGYTFDQLGLKKIGISNIRIYANAQNPFTFTKEKLVDPESRGQMGKYPLTKTWSAGVSINF